MLTGGGGGGGTGNDEDYSAVMITGYNNYNLYFVHNTPYFHRQRNSTDKT